MLCRHRHSTDNAVGLFHTTGPKLPELAGKYRPLLPIVGGLILRPDTPLEDDVKLMIAVQFDRAGARLAAICDDREQSEACCPAPPHTALHGQE